MAILEVLSLVKPLAKHKESDQRCMEYMEGLVEVLEALLQVKSE